MLRQGREHSGNLWSLNHSPEHGSAAERVAPKLSDEENDAGCRKKETREVAMLAAMRQPEKKTRCNREETECGISLDGMNGNPKWGIAPTCGKRVSVGDSPWNVRARAVAGTGKQSADLFECEAESERCRENISGSAKPQMVDADVDCGNSKRDDCPDGGEKRMMNHRQAKHPERMVAKHRPVCDSSNRRNRPAP